MPLSSYNKNPKCFHHYTIKPGPPEEKNGIKVKIIPIPKPARNFTAVKGRILACDPEIFRDMTILQIAKMFGCNPPSLYNVMFSHGIEYRRGRKKGGGRKKTS